MTTSCAGCGILFEPRPQVPGQTYCSAPDCQRARKRQWQRAKLESDPDYRTNQRAAQQAWALRHRNYWRDYRGEPTGTDLLKTEPNPTLDRETARVKMDVYDLPGGLYRITRHPAFPIGSDGSLIVKITPA